MRSFTLLAVAASLSACGGADTTPSAENAVSLRNLADLDDPSRTDGQYRIEGDLIPTPSDTASRYYLLRERTTIGGKTIAIVKQQKGARAAYARIELSCAENKLHILGVGDRRVQAETSIAYDGALRSTDGLPLRQEILRYICR